jgi:hypothetical protein
VVTQKLVEYVQAQKKKGFTESSIRATLIRYGHSPTEVNNALVATSHSIPIKTIGILAVVLIGITFGAYFFFTTNATFETSESIDITLEADSTVRSGDILSFTISLETEAISSGRVRYTVFDQENNPITSKEESISINKNTIQRDTLILPHTTPQGSYTLAATLVTGKTREESTTSFDVSGQAATVRIIEQTVGGATITQEDKIDNIVSEAEENPTQARQHCLEFANDALKDQCLLKAGLKTHNDLFCPAIKNDDKRDTCYFNLVLITREGMLCDDISNSNLKNTCIKI